MPKQLLQDMLKVNHPKGEMRPSFYESGPERKEPGKKEPAGNEIGNEVRQMYETDETSGGKGRTRYALWTVAFISVVFLFFSASFLFSKATVTINPKMVEVVLNENFSGSKNSDTADSSAYLPFDMVVISGEESKTLPADGEQEISERAKGTVLIYNTFSSSSQRLDIETRLEGSNGKIYKTDKAIVVPGMKKDGKPGSVEVNIHASAPGAEYNSAPLDFKIFGFKGTPKYSKFYGRSKGEITGGFTGKSLVVSDTDKAAATSELQTALKEKLLQKAMIQIPSGFVLFKDAIFLDVNDKNFELSALPNSMSSLKFKGTLYGILFDEKKLTKKIAEDVLEKYDGAEVFIPDIRELNFSLLGRDNSSLKDVKNINFNLSGSKKIVWKFDTEKLAGELSGKFKKEFSQILARYPNIDSADLVVSPIWKRSIPEDAKNIKIIVNYPE